MLKKLEIKNFQSHEHTVITFDPGVNIIYGLSQAGKTAILRAMRLAIYNRPSGAKYYSNFAAPKGRTEISIELDNGTIHLAKSIKRAKDGQKVLEGTQYEMQGMTFSPGVDVPEEVRKIFNVTDINIQNQFDSPFLATSSPGEIARTINRITKLEEVDGWKTDLTKKINRTNQESEILVGQIKQIEIELGKYQGFEELQAQINDLQKIDAEYRTINVKINSLDNILMKTEELEKQINRISPVLGLLEDLEAAEIEFVAAYNQIKRLEGIKSLQIQINGYMAIVEDLTRLLGIEQIIEFTATLNSEIEGIKTFENKIHDLQELIPGLERLVEIEDISKWRNVLSVRMMVIKDLDDIINKGHKEITEHVLQYTAILNRDKQCPVCMSPINATVIKRIQKELD